MTSPAALADAFARLRSIGFVCDAARLTDYDLPRVGHLIGVGEDEIHAVMDVEASGGGFDRLRRPKMLFESHVFYRCLPEAKRARAVSLGLAYKAWKPGAYPTDSYPRLAQAMAIDETAALKACSWGLGQILGENYVAAGYGTPQAMVIAFCDLGEAEHLEAMIRFIKAKRLDDELRRHDWAGFARGYNGASYARHGYDKKLAAAFAKWSRIKDTPWTPGQVDPPPPFIPAAPAKPALTGGLFHAPSPSRQIPEAPASRVVPAGNGFWRSLIDTVRTNMTKGP